VTKKEKRETIYYMNPKINSGLSKLDIGIDQPPTCKVAEHCVPSREKSR